MITLHVPDMSCGHCKASVEAALAPIAGKVQVDLSTRQVSAEGAAAEALIKALDDIGFAASALG